MPKGIRLSDRYSERQNQINAYIKELGGIPVKVYRGYSRDGTASFGPTRSGGCSPSGIKKNSAEDWWDEQTCFGSGNVFQKCHKRYDEVEHYTLKKCIKACWKEAIVVCVRSMASTGIEYMTTHIAGECPYCTYHLNFRRGPHK